MMDLVGAATTMLLINAAWDLVASFAMMVFFSCGYLENIASMHLRFWVDAEDQRSGPATLLMAFLVLQWSWVRLTASVAFHDRWGDAAFTYWLEGTLVGICTLLGKMHTGRGAFVVFMCFFCWEAVVVAGYDSRNL